MTWDQKERMLLIRSHLEFVQMELAAIDAKVDDFVAPL